MPSFSPGLTKRPHSDSQTQSFFASFLTSLPLLCCTEGKVCSSPGSLLFPRTPGKGLAVCDLDPILITKPVTVTGGCHELTGQNHRPETLPGTKDVC